MWVELMQNTLQVTPNHYIACEACMYSYMSCDPDYSTLLHPMNRQRSVSKSWHRIHSYPSILIPGKLYLVGPDAAKDRLGHL